MYFVNINNNVKYNMNMKKIVKNNTTNVSMSDNTNLIHNKYFRTVLIAYYSLTRNRNIIEAIEDTKNEVLLKNLFEEYQQYLAGFDVSVKEEDIGDNTLKVPETTTIKAFNILSILKKHPKI